MATRRAQVERNLRRIHGAGLRRRRARRDVAATFDSYGRYFYELFRSPTLTPEWINAHFHCTGIEHVWGGRRTRGRARCSRCRTSATGTSRRVARARRASRSTVVAEPVEPPELFEWFVETRRASACG